MCSRLKRQFVWREGAGNDSVVGYSGYWGSFLELYKTIHIFFNHLKDMVMSGYEEGDDCLTILPVGDVVVGDVRV